ncbi:MAG: Fe-S cluster assembly protein SufD [Sphingomonadales bacterium]
MTRLEIANVAAFRKQFAALDGAGHEWLGDLRAAAFDRFARSGFPGRKIESWRFTNVTGLAKAALAPVVPVDAIDPVELQDRLPDPQTGPRLVFVDGRLATDFCVFDGLPDGVEISGLADMLAQKPDLISEALKSGLAATGQDDDQALAVLNAAMFSDGAVIRIGENVKSDTPLHVVYVASSRCGASAIHLRNLILAAAGSHVSVVESFIGLGDGDYWTNVVTQVSAERNARVSHYRLQAESPGAFHIAKTAVRLAENSRYENFALTTGGRLSRSEIGVVMGGVLSHCALSGISLAGGGQHCDTLSRIDHVHPECESRQDYRSVVADAGHSVFQGKAIVRSDAQHTDARQASKNLLLAKSAVAITKPEFEIYADEVKCSHGATVGELDSDMLFYLRSRGLDLPAARALLIEGFVAQLLDSIEIDAVRSYLAAAAADWRPGRLPTTRAA